MKIKTNVRAGKNGADDTLPEDVSGQSSGGSKGGGGGGGKTPRCAGV